MRALQWREAVRGINLAEDPRPARLPCPSALSDLRAFLTGFVILFPGTVHELARGF
jgi:hypothetical protein